MSFTLSLSFSANGLYKLNTIAVWNPNSAKDNVFNTDVKVL